MPWEKNVKVRKVQSAGQIVILGFFCFCFFPPNILLLLSFAIVGQTSKQHTETPRSSSNSAEAAHSQTELFTTTHDNVGLRYPELSSCTIKWSLTTSGLITLLECNKRNLIFWYSCGRLRHTANLNTALKKIINVFNPFPTLHGKSCVAQNSCLYDSRHMLMSKGNS